MIFCARATRGLRRASLDGRSQNLLTPLLSGALNWKREHELTPAVGIILALRSLAGRAV